jgi:hypothetical protein
MTDPGATANPWKTSWNDGVRFSGEVFRFVTWVDDPCCTGTQDYKRISVVVTSTGHAPFINTTIMRKP